MAIINTNIIALDTQNDLKETQSALAISLKRLSSGKKINGAADDPARLAIADRMSSQLSGLKQAASNASEGISMLQTADGGLANTTKLLQKMRSLAVQAANGTNSQSDLNSLQDEVTQIQAQIQQQAMQTQYNGINLLDGTMSNLQFQVGANSGQTISFGIASAQQNALGNNVVGLTAASGNGSGYAITEAATAAPSPVVNNVQAQTLTVQGNGSVQSIAVTAGQSAQSIAAAFNNVSATTGITVSATTTATLAFTQAGTQSFTINGQQITASYSSDYTAAVNAINQQTGNTGVKASLNGANGITLSNTTGADIAVVNTSNVTGNTLSFAGTTSAGAAGTAVTLAIAGVGNNVASVVGGTLKFNSPSGFAITTSVGSATTGGLFNATTANGSSLNTVGGINVTTLSSNGTPIGANKAIQVIDAAIAQVNTSRGQLGALQNRFSATVSNLNTASVNLASSLSTIQDTDFATETTNLSRNQILQQAGTAMLAQANQLPSGVLALLR